MSNFPSIEFPDARFITGDCVDVMKTIPDASIDVVVTSPPYNIDIDYHGYSDTMKPQDYQAWCAVWMKEVKRILTRQGSFFLNISGSRKKAWTPFQICGMACAAKSGPRFKLQNEIVWSKSIHIGGDIYHDAVSQAVDKTIRGEEATEILTGVLKSLAKISGESADASKNLLAEISKMTPEQSHKVAKKLTSEIRNQVVKDRSKDFPPPKGSRKQSDIAVEEFHRRQRGHTFGHVKPVAGSNYLNGTHEFIFHLTKRKDVSLSRYAEGVGAPFVHPSNYVRWRQNKRKKMEGLTESSFQDEDYRFVKCNGNTWHIPYGTIQKKMERAGHPAVFPIGLPERCIRLHGTSDDKTLCVLDCFGGIGTTAMACRNISRNTGARIHCTSIELAERYNNSAAQFYEENLGVL